MKKETIIYAALCGLMMSSASLASNDEFTTPEKTQLRKAVEGYTPFSGSIIEAQEKAKLLNAKKTKIQEEQFKVARKLILDEADKRDKAKDEKHQQAMKELEEQIQQLLLIKNNETKHVELLTQRLQKLTEENKILQEKTAELTKTHEETLLLKTTELEKLQGEYDDASSKLKIANETVGHDKDKIIELEASQASRKKALEALKSFIEETTKELLKTKEELSAKLLEESRLQTELNSKTQDLARAEEKLALLQKGVLERPQSPTEVKPKETSIPSQFDIGVDEDE